MPEKYYLDTSIWIDYYENRSDNFRPLGDWAHKLLSLIDCNKDVLLISSLLMEELELHFSQKEVCSMLEPYKEIMTTIKVNQNQLAEARQKAKERDIPKADALHAIIARDNNAILITRDHHFEKLIDITRSCKPEELI